MFHLNDSRFSQWIFTLLVPIDTRMNTLQGSYKIYTFALTVSPHYLIKLKPHNRVVYAWCYSLCTRMVHIIQIVAIYHVHAQCTRPIEVNNHPHTDDALVLDNDQFLNMQTVGEVKF